MRHYHVTPNPWDETTWTLRVDDLPIQPNAIYQFLLRDLTEQQAHAAGVFARMNEDVEMGALYEMTERHIGREVVYG